MNNETHATYSDQAFASVMGNVYIVTGKLSSSQYIPPIAARLADDIVPRALLAISGARVGSI